MATQCSPEKLPVPDEERSKSSKLRRHTPPELTSTSSARQRRGLAQHLERVGNVFVAEKAFEHFVVRAAPAPNLAGDPLVGGVGQGAGEAGGDCSEEVFGIRDRQCCEQGQRTTSGQCTSGAAARRRLSHWEACQAAEAGEAGEGVMGLKRKRGWTHRKRQHHKLGSAEAAPVHAQNEAAYEGVSESGGVTAGTVQGQDCSCTFMEELSAFLGHMHSLGSDAPMEYMLELMCGSCPGGQMLSQVYPEGRWGHIGVDILSDTALRCYPGFCSLQSRPESHFKREP